MAADRKLMITSVAEQLNLLARNATIEAVRAADSGFVLTGAVVTELAPAAVPPSRSGGDEVQPSDPVGIADAAPEVAEIAPEPDELARIAAELNSSAAELPA
jgi:hypothetical protein